MEPFVLFIQSMRAKAEIESVSELLRDIIETTGYVHELEAEGTDEAEARIENIDELISKACDYEDGEEHPTLSGFLEEVALVADIDSLDEDSDYVVLMTLHSAKGLEFERVYLIDVNEGMTPYKKAVLEPDIEEERRLFPCQEESDHHFGARAYGARTDTVWSSIAFCQGDSTGTAGRRNL